MATLRAGSIEARDQRDPEALPGTAGLPGWDQAGLPRRRRQAPGEQTPPGAEAALRGRYAAKPSLSDSQGAQARAELGGCNGQKWLLSQWPNNPLRPSPDSPYL